jgi:hypothetical protein
MTVSTSSTFRLYTNGSTPYAESASNAVYLQAFNNYSATTTADGVSNLYFNGVLTGTANQAAAAVQSGTSNFCVGGSTAGTRECNGTIAYVFLTSRVLTASEVAQVHDEMDKFVWGMRDVTIHEANILPVSSLCKASYGTWYGNQWADMKGSYNATRYGNVIVSGQENDTVGLRFHGLSTDYINLPFGSFPATNTGALEFIVTPFSNTGDVRFVSSRHSAGAGSELRSYSSGDGSLSMLFGTSNTIATSTLFRYGVPNQVACEWSYSAPNTSVTMYVNGVLVNTISFASTMPVPDISFDLGRYGAGGFDGIIHTFNTYNASMGANYWSQRYANTIRLTGSTIGYTAKESVSAVSSGYLTDTPFIVSSGSFKVSRELINGRQAKVIECITAGNLYATMSSLGLTSKTLMFGTWEFGIYKTNAGYIQIGLGCDTIGSRTTTGQDGYFVLHTDAERLNLIRSTNGAVGSMMYKENVAHSQWNFIRVRRANNGDFTFWLGNINLFLTTFKLFTNFNFSPLSFFQLFRNLFSFIFNFLVQYFGN